MMCRSTKNLRREKYLITLVPIGVNQTNGLVPFRQGTGPTKSVGNIVIIQPSRRQEIHAAHSIAIHWYNIGKGDGTWAVSFLVAAAEYRQIAGRNIQIMLNTTTGFHQLHKPWCVSLMKGEINAL